MQWLGIGFPIQVHIRADHFGLSVVRFDGQSTIQYQCFFSVASEKVVIGRDLVQRLEVARVELNCALKVSSGFVPAPLTPLDVAHQLEYPGIVWEALTSHFQLRQSAIIIEVSPIKILGTREVCFTCIRT